MSALRRQERSRKALRRAVAAYTALRGGAGHYGDTFPVTLRDAVIERAISSGRRFSANTIRDQLPVSDSHLVGARVHSYALRRVDGHPLMVCVGREPSTLLSTKSAEVKVWLGYDAHQTIHRAAHAAS